MNVVILIITIVLLATITWKTIDLALLFLRLRQDHLERQSIKIEEYDRLCSRFLRDTNETNHPISRAVVIYMTNMIGDGKAARRYFFETALRKPRPLTDPKIKEAEKELYDMVMETRDSFSKILGVGLLASSFSSVFFGTIVRRSILYVMPKDDRVGEPAQIMNLIQVISRIQNSYELSTATPDKHRA